MAQTTGAAFQSRVVRDRTQESLIIPSMKDGLAHSPSPSDGGGAGWGARRRLQDTKNEDVPQADDAFKDFGERA